ncbi:MAG: RlmE family RNA methyltransferase [Candidatus Heimdallarchaeota archaeon]|nr:RlmE family RNA methyltransferase [Candidatus Heimdallarchaeota archaeon]
MYPLVGVSNLDHRERQRKREFYYREAQREGYRSRASYKLVQIEEKFSVFKQGDLVLDLGAAPGGWSQIAVKYIGSRGRVYAIDLDYIEPLDYVITIQGDITDPKLIERLNTIIGEPVDIVISDLSPKVSGNWSTDHARQIFLSESALKLSVSGVLKKGGKFVCKLFQGDLFEDFISIIKKLFTVVYLYKPKASRKASAEIYVIAKGLKKGPLKDKYKPKDKKSEVEESD